MRRRVPDPPRRARTLRASGSCVARDPTPAELARLLAYVDAERSQLRAAARRRGEGRRRRRRPGSPRPTPRRGRSSPTCSSTSTRRSPRTRGVDRVNSQLPTPDSSAALHADHAPPLLRAGVLRPRRPGAGVAARSGRRVRGPVASDGEPPGGRARSRSLHHRRQGEARHLPVHGRRAVAARSLRSEAGADEARRPGHPRGVRQGRALRVHQGHAEAAGSPVRVPRSTASRAPQISELLPRTWRSSPTTSPSSGRCTRRSSTTRRRRSS